MRFILQYPDLHGPDGNLLDAGSIPDVARAAEAAGFDAIALTEHPAPSASWLAANGHQTLDPFVGLAAAAATTSRIRLLTYLAVLPYRNPLMLAKSAATVQLASNGRFVLGAGTGYLKSEYFAAGVPFDERNDLFDEALDVLALAWSGEPFSYAGRHFDARNVQCVPAPRQPIPIWLGGNSMRTMRRVANRAQGWMPLITSTDLAATTRSAYIGSIGDLVERLAVLRDLAADRVDAIDVTLMYHDRSITDVAGDGTERHRDELGRLADAGITHVVISPPWATAPDLTDRIATFGDRYLPGTDDLEHR